MADDVTAPATEVEDQPTDAPEAPETDQPTGGDEESFTDSYNPNEVPEEARPQLEAAYKQLQSAYTQKTQSLAQERQEAKQAQEVVQALANPETAPEVLKFFGLELEQEEQEPEFPLDPEERIDQMESQFQQWQQQQAEAMQAAQQEDELISQIESLEEKAGREFNEKEIKLLSGQINEPQALHDLLEEISGERQKQWEEDFRKGKTRTPRAPGSGTPASKAVDLSKLSGRELREAQDQLAAEAAEEAMASE